MKLVSRSKRTNCRDIVRILTSAKSTRDFVRETYTVPIVLVAMSVAVQADTKR